MKKELHSADRSKRETKLGRFERLAQRRVTEALRRLRLIGNLSNRQNYEYSEDHVRQIVDALDVEMKQLKQRFRQEETESERIFSFRK
jgi:hypothetical protein